MKTAITQDIDYCAELLKANRLVAIPTETVYGLAGNAMEEAAVTNIFELKGRPRFNPVIVHIHSLSQLDGLAQNVPENAMRLAKAFWPGSITLILPKHAKVPDIITAGKPTVGIRMPDHPLTLELLKKLPFPVAAPSANPFTRVSPTSVEHVSNYFNGRIPAILDGGPCSVGLESTIVGFDGESPIVYRKGGISVEDIEATVGSVTLLLENETAPQAPGMLLKHYAPRTPLVVSADVDASLKANTSKKVGVLSFFRDSFPQAALVKVLSTDASMEEAAQNLFASLHELDRAGLDLIVAERFPEKGLGRSINDRLHRAQN